MKILNPALFRMADKAKEPNAEHYFIKAEQIDALLDAGAIEIAMKRDRWWAIRRNGETKRWKRDPNRFRTPVKAGLRLHYAITERDLKELVGNYS